VRRLQARGYALNRRVFSSSAHSGARTGVVQLRGRTRDKSAKVISACRSISLQSSTAARSAQSNPGPRGGAIKMAGAFEAGDCTDFAQFAFHMAVASLPEVHLRAASHQHGNRGD